MRTLSISVAAVAMLSLSSTFTATQAATRGVTSTAPRLSTTDTTHLSFAAKKKPKKYGFCPPGQAKKYRC